MSTWTYKFLTVVIPRYYPLFIYNVYYPMFLFISSLHLNISSGCLVVIQRLNLVHSRPYLSLLGTIILSQISLSSKWRTSWTRATTPTRTTTPSCEVPVDPSCIFTTGLSSRRIWPSEALSLSDAWKDFVTPKDASISTTTLATSRRTAFIAMVQWGQISKS